MTLPHGGHPEAVCHRCGGLNIRSWMAPNELWRRVMPGDGIVCPQCFVALAEAAGMAPTVWTLVPEPPA